MSVMVQGNTITVSDGLKNIEAFHEVRKAMDAMVKDKKSEINIHMSGCTTLSSSFIGQILKISKKDKVPVSIMTDNHKLKRFVEDMKLQEYIKVQTP